MRCYMNSFILLAIRNDTAVNTSLKLTYHRSWPSSLSYPPIEIVPFPCAERTIPKYLAVVVHWCVVHRICVDSSMCRDDHPLLSVVVMTTTTTTVVVVAHEIWCIPFEIAVDIIVATLVFPPTKTYRPFAGHTKSKSHVRRETITIRPVPRAVLRWYQPRRQWSQCASPPGSVDDWNVSWQSYVSSYWELSSSSSL